LLLFTCGGDCEAIEQYVLERVISIQLQNYKKAVTIHKIQADYYGCYFDLSVPALLHLWLTQLISFLSQLFGLLIE
jgi:hypothetical protein